MMLYLGLLTPLLKIFMHFDREITDFKKKLLKYISIVLFN